MEFAGPDSLIDFDTVKAQRAIRYFDLTLAPRSDFFEEWDALESEKRRMVRAAVLKELFDDGYEDLEERLKSSSLIAREMGYNPGNLPSDTTLWRGIRDLDDDVIEEAARRADNAVLHAQLPRGRSLEAVGTNPEKPRFYYEITKYDREISTERKMQEVADIVAEYMELAVPSVSFDRDSDGPNYKYTPESFYRLLAHIALEDCYATNGAEMLRWLTDDDVDVPDPTTLHKYARKYDVDEHAERFLDATQALLERNGLLPTEPVHLGFDITKVPWYGKVDTDDEGAPTDEEWRIKTKVKDNSTWFWGIAVLSIVTPDRNYVLGFQPVDAADEYDRTLNDMLERTEDRFDLELGRIYLDSGLGNTKIMDVCEEHGLNWLIKGEMNGSREELVQKLPTNTPGGQKNVEFGEEKKEINIFACPDHEETIKSTGKDVDDKSHRSTLSEFTSESDNEPASTDTKTDGSDASNDVNYAEGEGVKIRDELQIEGDGTWSVWNTNMDVAERDLRGLGYQYRYRWRVETAIRQLKWDFIGRCGSESAQVRAFYLGTGQLLFNFWVGLNRELPYRFDHTGVRVTAVELLHGVREADFGTAKPRRRI
jgi:hypothetical protein